MSAAVYDSSVSEVAECVSHALVSSLRRIRDISEEESRILSQLLLPVVDTVSGLGVSSGSYTQRSHVKRLMGLSHSHIYIHMFTCNDIYAQWRLISVSDLCKVVYAHVQLG